MSWRNGMARHGSETNLGDTLSRMNSGGARAPATSPTSATSVATLTDSRRLAPHSQDPNENNVSSGIAGGGSTVVQASSAGNSRIPGPSPTSLRRSASMRLRGERLGGVTSVRRSSGSSILYQQQQQQHQQHQQQQQQQANNRRRTTQEFPVITENGVDPHRNRSFSLSLTPARPRAAGHSGETGQMSSMQQQQQQQQQVDDSDAESVKSYGSSCSTASACDHAHFALNGTTWSGRSRKYVVHCSNHNSSGGDGQQYLTPTQRAARQMRKFENLLDEARKRIEEKDREISRLTKELVELRLYKASLNSPDDRTDSSSEAPTVREAANAFSPDSPESLDSPMKDLPESPGTPEGRDPVGPVGGSGQVDDEPVSSTTTQRTTNRRSDSSAETQVDFTTPSSTRLVETYERRILEMQNQHVDELQQLRAKHNDKVESLLGQLSEVNTRYCQIRPAMDAAEAKVRHLQTELESARSQLAEQRAIFDEQEERNKQMYLKMYTKGREAARMEQADEVCERADKADSPKITMAEVLERLNITQAELDNVKQQGATSYLSEFGISADRGQCLLSAQEAVSLWVLATRKALYRRIVESRNRQGALDPEITLQFLKSAIYYFLTDKENHRGHLSAIESILGFTDNEKLNIDKVYGSMRK